MKQSATELRHAISAKDTQKAERILLAGLAGNPDKFVEVLREQGVFRTYRYGFRSDTIAPLVETALSRGGKDLSPSSQAYLKSVLALSELAPAVAARLKKVRMVVNSGQFKTFLVAVELLFRRMHAKVIEENISTWRNYALEELAEGFSYYFSLLREKENLSITDINTLHPIRLNSDFYVDKLAALASIVRFREAEFQIEAFPYIASTSDQETTVQALSPDFEKSLRWGYIISEEQRNADGTRLMAEGGPSLKDLATGFVEGLGDRAFEVIQGPSARIRIHFPLIEKFVEAFTGNAFFVEDVAFIRDTMKSLFVTYEDLRATPVHNSITLIDVLKFRRVCVFLQAALDEYCQRQKLLADPVYYRSLVAHLSEPQALDWISKLTGIADSKSVLDLFCSTDEKSAVFDLQYTPVMRAAGQYLVPIGVVANCNALRNALQRSRFRFDAGARIDPLGDQLVAAFQHAGVPAKAKIKVRHAGADAEVDVLAMIDKHLFAFECKNSLHPCNAYELRQSYVYILKATSQLTRFTELLKDAQFRRSVSTVAGFDVTSYAGLTTCIVTGNRMFSGHREGGHAVRNAHELENVIIGGKLVLLPFAEDPAKPDSPKTRVRVNSWQGSELSASDLVRYIERDSWHAPAFSAMYPHDEVIPFGRRSLRFKSFMLDVGLYRDLMRKHPQAVEEQLRN